MEEFASSIAYAERPNEVMKVIVVKNSVYIQPPHSSIIEGSIRVKETSSQGPVIHWTSSTDDNNFTDLEEVKQVNDCDVCEDSSNLNGLEWTLVNSVSYKKEDSEVKINSAPRLAVTAFSHDICVAINDLLWVKRSSPLTGWATLTFMKRDEVQLPEMHFHNGGSRDVVKAMSKYVCLKRDPLNKRRYNIEPNRVDALTESFHELEIFPENRGDIANNYFTNPALLTYSGLSSGISKVGKFLFNPLYGARSKRPAFEMSENCMPEVIAPIDFSPKQSVCLPLPHYLNVSHEVDEAIRRPRPVTQHVWATHVQNGEVLQNADTLVQKIYSGGLGKEVRKEGWLFLLGIYSWDITPKERQVLRAKHADEYYSMKLQWKTMTPVQIKNNTMFKERKCLVEKDVERTDRLSDFYRGDNQSNLDTLQDILMTYLMYDSDLGYVQGMSDILSVILQVQLEEVDAFWCFVAFIDRIHTNFEMSQEGMKSQLANLCLLMGSIDADFAAFLVEKQSADMFFCFRWLLIMFKREFSLADNVRLWDVLFTEKPCNNFHLLFSAAILIRERDEMMNNNLDFNDILKYVNDLSQCIDLDNCLLLADFLYVQLEAGKDKLPSAVSEILGFPIESDDNEQGISESDDPSDTDDVEVLKEPHDIVFG